MTTNREATIWLNALTRVMYPTQENDALCHSYLGSNEVAGRMGLFGRPDHCGQRGDDDSLAQGVEE